MSDDPKRRPKTNGKDPDNDKDRKELPWPDDNVPRPPNMPPDQPNPES